MARSEVEVEKPRRCPQAAMTRASHTWAGARSDFPEFMTRNAKARDEDIRPEYAVLYAALIIGSLIRGLRSRPSNWHLSVALSQRSRVNCNRIQDRMIDLRHARISYLGWNGLRRLLFKHHSYRLLWYLGLTMAPQWPFSSLPRRGLSYQARGHFWLGPV